MLGAQHGDGALGLHAGPWDYSSTSSEDEPPAVDIDEPHAWLDLLDTPMVEQAVVTCVGLASPSVCLATPRRITRKSKGPAALLSPTLTPKTAKQEVVVRQEVVAKQEVVKQEVAGVKQEVKQEVVKQEVKQKKVKVKQEVVVPTGPSRQQGGRWSSNLARIALGKSSRDTDRKSVLCEDDIIQNKKGSYVSKAKSTHGKTIAAKPGGFSWWHEAREIVRKREGIRNTMLGGESAAGQRFLASVHAEYLIVQLKHESQDSS